MTNALAGNRVARRVRRVARRAADASVRATSPLRMRPDFLIVGAQRCGTTSMFKTLTQHPNVARPFLRKGVHFFDKKYDAGLGWYVGHFPIVATSRIRRGGRRPLTGESSPYYLFHPLAPARIATDLPGIRLVIMLRDPVERAYSAHAHERARGFETLSFEEAVTAEPHRLVGERERMLADPAYDSSDWQHHAYLRRGVYIEQLLHLESLVGRDRILPVDSQEFFTDPLPHFEEVLDFLGLERAENIVFEQHNARPRSPMPDRLREELSLHFEPYDAQLAQWWGRTPSWRR